MQYTHLTSLRTQRYMRECACTPNILHSYVHWTLYMYVYIYLYTHVCMCICKQIIDYTVMLDIITGCTNTTRKHNEWTTHTCKLSVNVCTRESNRVRRCTCALVWLVCRRKMYGWDCKPVEYCPMSVAGRVFRQTLLNTWRCRKREYLGRDRRRRLADHLETSEWTPLVRISYLLIRGSSVGWWLESGLPEIGIRGEFGQVRENHLKAELVLVLSKKNIIVCLRG